ncbi:phosphopantetheine-binding protein [Streptomyces sp. NBC_01275]|uniref:acyl carrier protein n=1 Tax=Streptomyces sp. NBC_01275 TaxID=2903807 RepID=UPI0022560E28|nr:acyl carrier protein [Streptomyces sp. NBC_01275]MCX4762829.1 phosphopantetheine-binding protein [Streptomyces sp. NBC_01275]
MTGEELRTAVRTIWREVLGADVDDDTDFFDAGGTSFAALRIVATLNDRHGTPTPVKVLFDSPRFADFVAVLDKEPELSPHS